MNTRRVALGVLIGIGLLLSGGCSGSELVVEVLAVRPSTNEIKVCADRGTETYGVAGEILADLQVGQFAKIELVGDQVVAATPIDADGRTSRCEVVNSIESAPSTVVGRPVPVPASDS